MVHVASAVAHNTTLTTRHATHGGDYAVSPRTRYIRSLSHAPYKLATLECTVSPVGGHSGLSVSDTTVGSERHI